jgi:hypothetical protein
MKKYLLLAVAGMFFVQASVQAAGGVGPCLATCFLGDSRIGLYMNEGKPIEGTDWLVFGANIAGSVLGSALFSSEDNPGGTSIPIGSVIAGVDAYNKSKSAKGFCAGALWGRRSGAEINTTKIRTKEILMCIPIVNIYPCIAVPLEAYSGKTMSQVIEEENLKR